MGKTKLHAEPEFMYPTPRTWRLSYDDGDDLRSSISFIIVELGNSTSNHHDITTCLVYVVFHLFYANDYSMLNSKMDVSLTGFDVLMRIGFVN